MRRRPSVGGQVRRGAAPRGVDCHVEHREHRETVAGVEIVAYDAFLKAQVVVLVLSLGQAAAAQVAEEGEEQVAGPEAP